MSNRTVRTVLGPNGYWARVIHLRDLEEFKVVLYQYSVRFPDAADYFTPCRDDAIATAQCMVERGAV